MPGLSKGIRIVSASYGANCGARIGNVSPMLRNACNGLERCEYIIDVSKLGDPAPRCGKAFATEYTCAPSSTILTQEIPEEAGLGSKLTIECGPGIRVISATYGGNCGAKQGNATASLASACNGKSACEYTVSVGVLGDPANGCSKSFVAEHECAPSTRKLSTEIKGEAGQGTVLSLTCGKDAQR